MNNNEENKGNINPIPSENIFDNPSNDATSDATSVVKTINEVNNPNPTLNNNVSPIIENNNSEVEETIITPNESMTPIVNEQVDNNETLNNVETMQPINNDPDDKLQKRIIKEDEVKLPSDNHKANKIISFLGSVLVILVIGFGVYFLMKNNIIYNPFKVNDSNVILPPVTTTTTTTKAVTNPLAATYEGLLDTCPNNTMSLEVSNDSTFKMNLVDSTCNPITMYGTLTYNDTTKVISFLTSDNQNFTGNKNEELISVTYNALSYTLKKK